MENLYFGIILILLLIILYWYITRLKYLFTLKTNFRKLWADHGIYTRLYIIAYLTSNPDVSVIAERLMRNQEDLGNAVSQVLGNRVGDQLTILLKEHITGAVKILTDL